MSNLNKLAHIGELAPETMTAFRAWDKLALSDGAALRAGGAITHGTHLFEVFED
jgi:hypothetical protein